MAIKYDCHACKKQVTGTKNDRYRSHSDGSGEPCEMSSEPIPEHVLAHPVGPDDDPTVPREGVDYSVCPQCERKVKLTRLGYFEPHDQTMRGGDRCPVSGVRARHARKLEDVPLPGDEKPKPGAAVPGVRDSSTPVANRGLAITSPAPTSTSAVVDSFPPERLLTSGAGERPTSGKAPPATESSSPDATRVNLARDPMASALGASSSASTEASSPESTTTLTPSSSGSDPTPGTSSDAPGSPEESAAADSALPVLHLAPLLDDRILQPFSHILQPTPYEKAVAQPMGDLAKDLATKIKETFYSYSNRKTSDNRSAQTTLGPSEIGTPCDRRLAMTLLGVPPVNPGGDGWAAFVGTCTHVGMAEIYTFADAGTGRYAVELPVFLGVPTVPRGTTDLLDRRDGTVVDWKVMGVYSLKKFKLEGPSLTYRTQAHVYGLGAERGGEKVKNVAIVGLPRAGSSLDEMHIWTEKYDRKFAEAALARVERIAGEVAVHQGSRQIEVSPPGVRVRTPMEIARAFETGDDCRYCPFHLKGDKAMTRGCPGK